MIRMLRAIRRQLQRMAAIPRQLEQLQRAVGRIEMRQTAGADGLAEAEFQVSSQWGEDGIIQHLIRRVPIEHRYFVEFGVESYLEANTRFLLQQQNWSGLVLDGSPQNIQAIRNDPISWRYGLDAACAFVDASNINEVLAKHGATGDIGLLSIDIDGNDYWVWRAIHVVSPRILICEFNGIFGPSAAVTVPYDPKFVRSRAHYSCLLAGASLSALTHLGSERGYRLVGVNSAGNNAFFVRRDVGGSLPSVRPEDVYMTPHFREARHRDGTLAFLDIEKARALIADAVVVDVVTNRRGLVRDLVR